METIKKVGILFLLLFSFSSSAKLYQGANLPRPNDYSLGVYPTLLFSPSEFHVYGQWIYGLDPTWQLEARLGVTDGFMAGFYGKAAVAQAKEYSFSLWTGIEVSGTTSIDFFPVISRSFSTFEIYGAVATQFIFSDDVGFAFGVLAGSSFQMSPAWRIYTEANVSIKDYRNSFGAGARFFF